MRVQTDGQTHTQTDTHTGPIILPLPLTREVISPSFIKIRVLWRVHLRWTWTHYLSEGPEKIWTYLWKITYHPSSPNPNCKVPLFHRQKLLPHPLFTWIQTRVGGILPIPIIMTSTGRTTDILALNFRQIAPLIMMGALGDTDISLIKIYQPWYRQIFESTERL